MRVRARSHALRVSPRKMNITARLVKGMAVKQALEQLTMQKTRAARLLHTCLTSAVANARENHKLDPLELRVSAIVVGQGPRLKRYHPRAFGRTNAIRKPTSHLTVWVEGEHLLAQRPAVSANTGAHPTTTPTRLQRAEEQEEKRHHPTSLNPQHAPARKTFTTIRKFFQRKSGM